MGEARGGRCSAVDEARARDSTPTPAAEREQLASSLAQCQEERGAALLRAEQLETEAGRLREMVASLKRHDDELFASQSSSAAELRQVHAALAAAGSLLTQQRQQRRVAAAWRQWHALCRYASAHNRAKQLRIATQQERRQRERTESLEAEVASLRAQLSETSTSLATERWRTERHHEEATSLRAKLILAEERAKTDEQCRRAEVAETKLAAAEAALHSALAKLERAEAAAK